MGMALPKGRPFRLGENSFGVSLPKTSTSKDHDNCAISVKATMVNGTATINANIVSFEGFVRKITLNNYLKQLP